MNQGLESTVDPNAHKYQQGGAAAFGFGGKAAPFQRYKECKYNYLHMKGSMVFSLFPFLDIQNVGDNLGAVYRARTGKQSAAYDPFSAGSSPQYQQVQSYLQNRSNAYPNNSSNFSFGSTSAPSLPPQGNFAMNAYNANPFSAPQAPQPQLPVKAQMPPGIPPKPTSFSFGGTTPAPPTAPLPA